MALEEEVDLDPVISEAREHIFMSMEGKSPREVAYHYKKAQESPVLHDRALIKQYIESRGVSFRIMVRYHSRDKLIGQRLGDTFAMSILRTNGEKTENGKPGDYEQPDCA